MGRQVGPQFFCSEIIPEKLRRFHAHVLQEDRFRFSPHQGLKSGTTFNESEIAGRQVYKQMLLGGCKIFRVIIHTLTFPILIGNIYSSPQSKSTTSFAPKL